MRILVFSQPGPPQIDIHIAFDWGDELYVTVERQGRNYGLNELIRHSDFVLGAKRKDPIVNAANFEGFLKQGAELLLKYGEAALKNDQNFFDHMDAQRKDPGLEEKLRRARKKLL